MILKQNLHGCILSSCLHLLRTFPFEEFTNTLFARQLESSKLINHVMCKMKQELDHSLLVKLYNFLIYRHFFPSCLHHSR